MYRTSKNQIIGGVCGAIGQKLGMKALYVRLICGVLSMYLFPFSVLLYFALCVIIPKRDDLTAENSTNNSVISKPMTTNVNKNEGKIKNIVEQINKISSGILNRQKGNTLVQRLISEYKNEITEFQKFTPELQKQYLSCIAYLNDKENNIDHLKSNIVSLKDKAANSPGSVKDNYLSIIDQQEKRIKTLEEIKEYTQVSEAKLYLILNTLQNIEATIMHAELQSQVDDSNYENLQSQISILTDSMSEMSDIYRRNKMRI